MTHDPRPIITRFLGAQALEHGPFGLLGVSPDECEPSHIDAALQRQLDRVASHREGDTPAADDVRLALHAAAAQLLDPRVRKHLIDRWGTPWREAERAGRLAPASPVHSTATARARTPAPGRPAPQDLDERIRQRDDDGRRELMRVVVFISAAAVLLIAIGLAGLVIMNPSRGGSPPAGAAPAAGSGPAAQSTPASSPSPSPSLSEAAQNAAPIEPAGADAAPAVSAARATTDFEDPRRTLHALRECANAARDDPRAALQQLDQSLRRLADWWPRFDPAVRRACNDAVVDVIFALAPHSEPLAAAVESISAPSIAVGAPSGTAQSPRPRLHPAEVWPAVWSVGMLSRLSRERDVPTSVVTAVADALDARLGAARSIEPNFESGAIAALRRLPPLLLTDREARTTPRESAGGASGSTAAIKRWIEAAQALGTDEAAQERLLALGLEQVLTACREPGEDLGVFEAIGELVRAIRWRKGSPARARLLDWFRDARISEADLRVVTAALASSSAAEGIDSTHVLSINSGADDRTRLRAAYATAWGIESAGGDRASGEWVTQAQTALSTQRPADPMTLLRDTAGLARLNEAARLLWRGESSTASALLKDAAQAERIGPMAVQPTPNTVIARHSGGGSSGSWAERFLAAERSIPARLELIAELDRRGRPIDPIDASLLAREAVIGSPIQVRHAAAKLVGLWADEPALVHSVLDELPGAPRTAALGDLIERMTRQRLPRVTDAAWELAARRAMVERLLGMLALGSGESTFEAYAELIADSYLRASGQEPGRGAGAAAEGAAKGAESLWAMLRAEAEAAAPVENAPIQLDRIDRRRLGRLSLADGPVQVFAAQQVSIAEAMAFIVVGERPTAARAASGVIETMQAERRASKHVFEQLYATELALLKLWMIRFGVETGGGS